MKKLSIFFAAILIFLSPLFAEETEYTNNSFARLSFLTGSTFIQKAADLGYEEAVVNMPISEGDRLGTTDGRAEIYLGNGNYVRLDEETKIDFMNLPKKGYELVRVRIWTGNAYFHVASLEEEKNIEIHTSDVSIYVLDVGLYRIDVRENDETEIFVFDGMVEAAGETGSVLIKNEQKLEVSNARFTSRPTQFAAVAEDSFDRWSANRDSQIRKHLAKKYLPEELEDFEYELAEYGDWVYIAPYGYVWVPGGVDSAWRPYFYGRWTWMPLAGWTWIPYEPWGWCTYHYGRWHWQYGLGWYWIPTTLWGPAWVSWYWGYDYFGWVPLSYYGYPGVIINNIYYPRYVDSNYPSGSRILTVIHKNQLKARNVSRVALSEESIRKLGRISLSKENPSLRPTKSKVSAERLEGQKLMLRKIERPPEGRETKRLSQSTVRKPESVDVRRTDKKELSDSRTSDERRILDKRSSPTQNVREKESSASSAKKVVKKSSYGYPPSPEISVKNYPRKIKTRKSSSLVNRITSGTSKSSRSARISSSSQRSSRSSSSKGISSSSRSRSSASSARRSSSASRSSRSSGSRSVRKKK
ncbi:MAG: FecR domain-containing protein [Candidatus Aminicenantes bacterium]|nr:MAG: FecR domain-containing protein [Candidatus Aminicenantes bacterium]